VAIEATFKWTTGLDEDPGIFVWRQQGGMRRWDTFDSEKVGTFSLQSNVADSWLSTSFFSCSWLTGDHVEYHVSCSDEWPSDTVSDLLFVALNSPLSDGALERSIIGRPAHCFVVSLPPSTGEACFDDASGLTLRVQNYAESRGPGLEALSLESSVTDFRIAAPLPQRVQHIEDSRPFTFEELRLPNVRWGD
jgi:hypothetical protein